MQKHSITAALCALVLFAQCAGAQGTVKLDEGARTPLAGWQKWSFEKKDGTRIDAYGVVDVSTRNPVLVMITGSRCAPLLRERDGKTVSPLFITDPAYFRRKGVQAIAVERRGISSFKPIPETVAAKEPRQRCSEEYGGLDKQERVDDVAFALAALQKQPWFGRIFIMGHSEGVDIAAGVAKSLAGDGIASLGLFSGATSSLFFDFVVGARLADDETQVQSVFDGLIWLTGPTAAGKYGGYPIKKFLSYAVNSSILDDTLATEVPLFVANGTADKKAAVAGADVFVVEVLRKQPRRAVHYVNYPDLDHEYVDKSGTDYSVKVFDQFIDWSFSADKGRKFEFRKF